MGTLIDLVGLKFGKWQVLSRGPNAGPQTQYLCKCICGKEKLVRACHLRNGVSTNCGCSRLGKALKHGGAIGRFSKKYKTWRSMRIRCLNPKDKNAHIYNGLLCERWLDFKLFDLDMPEPPSNEHTIDRIDNSKGYEPGNVRWATKAEQHRNQSNCRWITFNGETKLLTDWAKQLGITDAALHYRLSKWTLEKALTL